MVSDGQSPCRAEPGLKSHNARAKAGHVKGHLEKELPGPAVPRGTKRKPCAITRGQLVAHESRALHGT